MQIPSLRYGMTRQKEIQGSLRSPSLRSGFGRDDVGWEVKCNEDESGLQPSVPINSTYLGLSPQAGISRAVGAY